MGRYRAEQINLRLRKSRVMGLDVYVDIAEYRYAIYNDDRIQSAWLITFYESITFIGLVSSAEDGFFEEAD